MNYKLLFLLAPFLLLLGCQPESDRSADNDDVVLVLVDGKPVTLPMLERVMRAQGVGEQDHERMRELLEELIRMRAVANVAEREGVADEPEVRAELRLRELELLNHHYIDRQQRRHPVTDEDIETVYNRQRERAGDSQYRIETITFPEQAEALRALARVDDGVDDYDAVRAEAESAGLAIEQPGWIDLSQVPEDFAAALKGREAGTVVTLPLDTAQGWRLVKVLEQRELQAPPLEQVREGIARSLLQQRRRSLVDEIYEQAEIEPMLPLEE
jgi:peptidyl-prolyl cis-trans isomerase C